MAKTYLTKLFFKGVETPDVQISHVIKGEIESDGNFKGLYQNDEILRRPRLGESEDPGYEANWSDIEPLIPDLSAVTWDWEKGIVYIPQLAWDPATLTPETDIFIPGIIMYDKEDEHKHVILQVVYGA